MKKSLHTIWPATIWTLVIFVLLSLNGQTIKENSGIFDVEGADKIVHFFLFFCFSVLWILYGENKTNNKQSLYLLVIVTGSAYGLGMEYYQEFFTNREFSYWDAVADTAGTIAGIFLIKKSPYGNRGRNQN
ncbi:MAG: VanZ family protein [bacterium]|jgi:VanZ family protein